MKILIDGHMIGEYEGGNERYTYNLIKHLSKIAPIGIILYHKSPFHKQIEKSLQIYLFLKNDALRLLFVPFFMVLKKYDVLHVSYILPFFKLPHLKYVMTVHDLSFKRLPQLFSLKDRLLFTVFFPYSLRLADKIIVPSYFIRDEFTQFYPQYNKKLSVIYEGVDFIFHPIKSSHQEKSNFFLAISSKNPRKNINTIIEAFLNANLSKIKLIIVGNRTIPNKMNKKKNIQYVGYVNDRKLNTLYNEALGLIYYSSYEGFGLPIIESLSLNTPVIASDTPCHREIGKAYPYYVKLNNVKSLKRAIEKIGKLKKKIQTRKRILSLYDWRATAKKTLQVYISLLKPSL